MKINQFYAIFFTLSLSAIQLAALSQNGSRTRSSVELHNRPPVHWKPGDPLWKRYQALGEQSFNKGDKATAKKYYLQALASVEKTLKTAANAHAHYERLEGDLVRLYPNYPKDRPPGEGEEQIKFDEEELSILSRLHRIDQTCGTGKNLPAQIIDGQIQCVQDDLNKNKAALEGDTKKSE